MNLVGQIRVEEREFRLPPNPRIECGGASVDLIIAAAMGRSDRIRKLMKTIKISSPCWTLALRKAAANGHREVVKIMLSEIRNCDRSKSWLTSALYTATLFAAQMKHPDVLSELTDYGTPTSLKGSEPVLCTAARAGSASAAIVLLKAGANAEEKNEHQETAFDIAKKHGHIQVAHLLRVWIASLPKMPVPPNKVQQHSRLRIARRVPRLECPQPPRRILSIESRELSHRTILSDDERNIRNYICEVLFKIDHRTSRLIRRRSLTPSSPSAQCSFFR